MHLYANVKGTMSETEDNCKQLVNNFIITKRILWI